MRVSAARGAVRGLLLGLAVTVAQAGGPVPVGAQAGAEARPGTGIEGPVPTAAPDRRASVGDPALPPARTIGRSPFDNPVGGPSLDARAHVAEHILEPSERPMAQSILVHVTHGPEHPTRAALAFAVAAAALEQGHTVSIFLAGDGVQLIRDGVLDNLNGLGTGNLRQSYDRFVAGGGRFYLSGGSSNARGVTERDLAGKPAEFAGPAQLVRLSLEHDRMFTY